MRHVCIRGNHSGLWQLQVTHRHVCVRGRGVPKISETRDFRALLKNQKGFPMLKAVLLSTAALALIATTADARPPVTLSKDNRFVSVMPQSGHSAPAQVPGSYAFSTIDKSKVGTYFCCYGSTISGPSSFFGHAYGVAEQFVPTS